MKSKRTHRFFPHTTLEFFNIPHAWKEGHRHVPAVREFLFPQSRLFSLAFSHLFPEANPAYTRKPFPKNKTKQK